MPHISHPYHFQNQHPHEQVLIVIHRHWFNILSHFLVILIFSVLLLMSFLAFPMLFPDLQNTATERLLFFVENTLFVLLWLFGFLLWIDYYFDVWIITNERIVNIEQRGLFVRHISELNFSSVQDVTAAVNGVIPTILNYGDVTVQTAGEEVRVIFRQVPDPYRVKDTIMKLSKNAIEKNERSVANALHTRREAL